ncbi:hypothetical protein RJD24_04725 [Bacillaceae bacterium IKA-2]|nr:hypothetical protein RJD24_04725 [Bacillaceae bacterium IKA-2]
MNFNNELKSVKYGVWVDGIFSWLDSEKWVCDSDKLSSKRNFTNENLKLSITFQPKFLATNTLQEVTIANLKAEKRNLKFFCSQTFTERGSEGLTFYAPSISAIVHSYDNTYLLVNGMLKKQGIVQYCTDFQDPCSLEDGTMLMQPFSSKRSVNIFSLEGEIQAKEKTNAYFWLCKGLDEKNVQQTNAFIKLQLLTSLDSETNFLKTV